MQRKWEKRGTIKLIINNYVGVSQKLVVCYSVSFGLEKDDALELKRKQRDSNIISLRRVYARFDFQ